MGAGDVDPGIWSELAKNGLELAVPSRLIAPVEQPANEPSAHNSLLARANIAPVIER